jgi:hypothetical protein
VYPRAGMAPASASARVAAARTASGLALRYYTMRDTTL